MVDGKVCNALSNTPSMKCFICGAKPTEMNQLEKCIAKNVKEKYFEFGLSPLHSYIRFFAYILHLSYKLEIKMWQARSAEHKLNVLQRKERVQAEFREKWESLLINQETEVKKLPTMEIQRGNFWKPQLGI